MTDKPTHEHAKSIRYDELANMPTPEPLSQAFKDLDDEEVERRAAADPDAGMVPPGFWDAAHPETTKPKE